VPFFLRQIVCQAAPNFSESFDAAQDESFDGVQDESFDGAQDERKDSPFMLRFSKHSESFFASW
jgi:hypothetical protein